MKSEPDGDFNDGLEASRRALIQNAAFDWLTLASETLDNAKPLTPEEQLSINEFFWTHFK